MPTNTSFRTNVQLNTCFSVLTTLLAKLPGTLLALVVFYVLPLIFKIDLLWSSTIWLPMWACCLVFLTQRSATKAQWADPYDQHSMQYLSIATLISQMTVVMEWAYWSHSHHLIWNMSTIVGITTIATGLLIRLWAIWTLGTYFQNTITILPNHQLVQRGIYRYIRHGSYTGAFLTAMGIGIFLSAWIGLFVSIVVLGAAYRYRILQEEKALITHFGHSYRSYQQKTWMLLPFIL